MPSPSEQLRPWLDRVLANHEAWAAEFGEFTQHGSLALKDSDVVAALDELAFRLRDNYPFFHPRYAGQMLKPPHPVAIAGYAAAMLINPNNHALDGGPATAKMDAKSSRSWPRCSATATIWGT